ncbi:MAG TPA: AAA family ATPase, partial [Terriglobia bacterium]|nr:AAA family ATPase [Terriglobia bacterium]
MSDSSPNPLTEHAEQPENNAPKGLLTALARLDALLGSAVAAMGGRDKEDLSAGFYRGLQIRPEDAERALAGTPGQPLFRSSATGPQNLAHDAPAFQWLAETFALIAFDLDVVLLALAPELDLRYERLYAYLQDDITRKRPTVDLALNLFADSAEEKLALRSRFAPGAPLARHELIRIFADPGAAEAPLLARYVKLDEQIVHLLLGHSQLDSRLANFARLTIPAAPPGGSNSIWQEPLAGRLAALAERAQREQKPLRLYFEGPETSGKQLAAEAVAQAAQGRILTVRLRPAAEAAFDLNALLRLVFREAWLTGAVLFLDGVDSLRRDERSASYPTLLELLAVQPGATILSGAEPWRPSPHAAGVLALRFGALDPAAARRSWEEHLTAAAIEISAPDVDLLASRYRLTSSQIADAVASAISLSGWRSTANQDIGQASGDVQVNLDDLCAAARAETGHELSRLARKVRPRQTWKDIVLPQDQMDQLREVCDCAKHWQTVFRAWGFDRKLSLGKGLNVLFSGPPGTGKTMAAEVLANELQLDLYKIDLSQVVSKYIGETERNLDRVFTAAENSNAILFFDEADALFGKRSEVKDSHDRYANIEIGYLLQKMEEYEGVAILATNVKHHIDEAFVRRMQAVVEFPFPEEAERRRVWQSAFPEEAPMGQEV